MMVKERNIDWFMFGIAASLALFGAMMVYSASAMFSPTVLLPVPGGP